MTFLWKHLLLMRKTDIQSCSIAEARIGLQNSLASCFAASKQGTVLCNNMQKACR